MGRENFYFKKRIRQGDLVIAQIYYSNLEYKEKRPAIVVSNNNFNSSNQNVILVPLTKSIRGEDSSLIISTGDLSFGRLKNVSVIRIDKIVGLHKDIVERVVGRMKDSVLEAILNKTRKILEKSI
tara:strand:- start:328 stop:702 length:375 start_codon:yes stop_codon:yes gene_type:complete